MSVAPGALAGLVATAALGLAAFGLRLVSLSGLVGGLAVGAVISLGFGWRGFALLALFFALGSAATRLRYTTKAAERTAQPNRGARGARHALANGACGTALAVWSLLDANAPAWLPVAFAGSFATALADTLGTEVGQAYGRTTIRSLSLRRVPRGTPGAISLAGTVAGALGALALGALGGAIGLFGAAASLAVAAAGALGSLLESALGALGFGRRLGGDLRNVLNTVAGAALAVALTPLVAALLGGNG